MNSVLNCTCKTSLLLCIILGVLAAELQAQKAGEVLEKGIRVKTGNKIFLRKEASLLKFDINPSPKDFTTLSDSTIFLVSKNGVNVYIRPLNPLNYSFKTANVIIVDPVSEDVSTALKSILDVLNTVAPQVTDVKGVKKALAAGDCVAYDNIKLLIQDIGDSLTNNRKDAVNAAFKALKTLSFEDEPMTVSELKEIKVSVGSIEAHFARADSMLAKMKKDIGSFPFTICKDLDPFVLKYVFTSIHKELESLKNEQKKRLKSIQDMYALVEGVQKKASIAKDGLRWLLVADEVPATEGKISLYTVTINESGYALSDKGEIEPTATKEVLKRTLRVRRFQRLIPEVSAGIAYTFLDYPEYGTAKNAAGESIVAETGKKSVTNLNFSAMINYNYFIPHSPIHPFWQIGVGANNQIPTLLTGVGLRSNFGGIRRIALAGGVALSWIKKLDKLSVGDKVSGTADLEKDLKYNFNIKQRHPFYVGIQYSL